MKRLRRKSERRIRVLNVSKPELNEDLEKIADDDFLRYK